MKGKPLIALNLKVQSKGRTRGRNNLRSHFRGWRTNDGVAGACVGKLCSFVGLVGLLFMRRDVPSW